MKQHLKLLQISDYCIQKGMQEIPDHDYEQTLKKLLIDKWDLLGKEKNYHTKKNKVISYLLQKGYEMELIFQVINELKIS